MPVYKYNGTTYDIPEDVVSDFEKDMPEATLAYQVDGTVYDIPVSEKKGFLDTYPNASLYGEEVAQPAPSAREQLQAFYQENGAFLDDFEKRDSADSKLSAAESMDGGFSLFGAKKNNSLVTDEERKQYGVLDAQRKQLEKAWYTSDEYLSQKNATALELGQMRDDIHNSKKAYVESQPQIKMSGLENAVMEGKTIGDYESQQFDIAARIMDKTIKLHNAPSKYDSNSGLKNMGIGAADKATDPALLSAGLTEITDNVGARVVLQKVQKELGNLNDLSEERIEKILSPAEKAVLRSWAMYAQEQLNRQGDLSLGYQAGQGTVESLAFMAEFALTGGVGKAASEGAETLAKWLGKKWYGLKGLGDEAAEAVMKAAGEKTLGKYGQKLGLALAETAGRTLVMPSAYRNISEKATEIEEDEDGNRYLIGLNDAFIKGYADSFIETLSEGGRVNALGELVGDIAGNIPAWKKMVNAFSNTKASELLKRLNSTGMMNTLRAGGWHGFGEEYLEEWYGNALRTITGVDKNALKDFATLDNQMVTLASFLPITIFGGTVSTGQVISAKRDLDKKAEALQSALMSRGYDEAQAKNMIDMMRAETPQGISNLITPLIRRVAGANENEARELAKPAMEFAWAVQRYQSYDTKYSYQQQEQRDNLKADMETKLGKFWMEGEDGQQTVQRGVNEKGEVVYLLGKKDIEETAEGIGAEKEVAAIDAEGNHIFVFPSDYRLEEELPMNDFLGIEIMTQKRDSEAVRMASERDAKLAEVKSRSRLGTQLNIGTNEAPVVATISKVDADGVVVETPEGFRKITYTELANKYADINPAVYTDAELDEQEADNISAERAQREAALDQEYENDDDAIEELAEAENEIEQSVEEATKLPLKDDGTVDQAALWNESPARWAKWNDEQKQDGGADTLAYLNTAIKAQTAKIEQLVAAQEAETDFDRRDAIAAELSEARMRQGDLLALHGQYTAQVEAQAIQQQAAQPVQPAPQLTEEEKAALEEERRKPLRAKAKELSEKLGVKVKIAEDLSDVKESKAREQLLKSVVSNGKQKVAGWYNQATGEVTIYLPHAESVEDVEKTFIHEVVAHKGLRGLLGEEGFNVLCDAVWDMMSEGDKIRFINYPGVNGDKRAAADEYMAHFAENLNLEEAKPDMWERIVAIIKQILDSMGVRLRINQEGLSSVIAASYQKLLADAKAAQAVSAEAVTETATETIAEEPQTGGAEEVSEERESFRVVNKQEDPNGVTPEQIDEINRSVGGELEVGEDDAPVRFSVTAIGEGAGLEILKDDGDGNVAFVLPDGRRFNANNLLKPEDIKSLPNTVLGYMMKDAKSLGNVDTAKEWMLWNKYTLMLNAILLKGSAENGGFDTLSSQWQWIGDTIYKTVAINSDSQYSFSLDITRVCKKNEAVINAIAEMQARLGYGITPGQIMDIYLTTSEEGYQVPCPVCYVFSRYIRNGKYATIMINGQRKYGNELVDPNSLTPKQKEKKVKFWLDELAKIKAENNEHSKEIAKANSDITTLLDEIDKIAKELTNPQNNFTEEEKAQMMSKIYELDARYKAALNVVSQASLDSWITQFAIHKVKIDGKEQWTLYEDSYMGFPEEMALDLRQTSTVMRKYPAIQRFRNSRGAAAGKEITFVANNDLGDVPLALGSSAATKDLARPRDMSDEEWEEIQGKEYADLKLGVKNLYQQAVEEKDPKKKAALLKKAKTRFTSASIYAKQQSLRGGQRMWSWSDNIERLAPDVFVNLLQLEMLGGALQSYSKQLEGIKLVASMNGYVNGSLMGKGNGYREVMAEQTEEVDGQLYLKDGDFVVAEPGKKPFILKTPVYQHTDGKLYVLEFDDVVGIDPFGKDVDGKHMKGLFELNAEYDRAGNIIVGMNDLHIRMCMADDRIFFIIPWHSSGANTHILAQMYEYLGVEYDVTLSQDYTDVQSEKRYKAPTEAEEEADSAAEGEATEEGDEKKESNKISQFLVDFWNDHYENAREYAGYGAVAGKDFACGIKGGVEPSDGNGNLSSSQMHYRELRDAIFLGVKVPIGVDKNGKPKTKAISVEEYSEEWFNEIMNDAFLSQVYTKVRALMGDKGMTSADTKAIYPYEYWDESSTYATADINGARYVEYCRRLGYKPKFCGKLDGKPESDHGNFTDDKGYWKVLIDRRMYAISGRFQDLTPVTADNFTPDLVDPEVTKEEFIVTRVADEAGTQTIVDKAIAREESRPGGIAKVDYDMTLSDALNVYNNGDVRMRASAPSGVIDLVEEAKKAVAREEAKDNVSFRITPEMKEIKEKTQADGTFMKAPNGQPTNLTEEQWLMVRTQNFKNWFGDWENDPENASKVVDENGEPKVVFHQTNQKIYVNRETGENWDELGWKEKMEWDERDDWENYWEEQDFNTFSRVNARTTNEFDGFFFAPKYDEYHEYGDRTIAAFVNIKNPASREDYNIDSRYNDAGRNERIRLQEAGFDGVIRMDGDNVDEYIAFEPNQIKSATDNNGDFNPENNDIRFRIANENQAIFVSNAAKAVEGIKVEDIELPNLEEAGRVMHSVPVTEEMKASVMEGQVMFRITESKGANESIPNYEFESDLRFRLSKNNRELIGKWLNKRGDLTEQAKEETLDLLDQFDDATLQLSMGKWFAQNAIRLPDDVEKCMQAVASAKKAKVDPMKFAAPMEIIDQYGVTKPKDKPINPDKVSTLSKVRELPNGLAIYDVEESEESRKNMREIINTHFGKESSPWCLLQGNEKGELTQKSAEYWKKYNAYPKQVVFKDGKLLAFCANDTEERRWWDRMDKSYAGIPVNEKLPNDRLGRSRVVEYNEETGKQAKVNDIKKFVTKDGMRSEWTWRTPKENDIKEYRKVKADTEEMVEGFDKSSWNIPSFLQKMLPKESVRFVRSAGVEMTFDAWGKILNYWDENTSIVYDGNETAIYTNDERYLYRNGKLVDVIDANNITYTGAETQRFSAKAKEHLTQAKDIQKNAKSIAKQMVADLQGESLRFRVRGENESAMDFTKKEVENFTKRFYDVAPIYVVDKFSSKAELAKAIEMDEQYITDEQYQEILDGYNGNGKAFYSADWSLIVTFAKSDNSDDIEHNLFHESVHKVDIEDIPDGGKLGQWFWDNADSIQDASKIKDAIENAPEYSEEDYAREMLAELLAWYMSIGETEILINQLPSEHQKTVKSILSEIRYDSREEDNLRQQPETTYSRAKDAIRKGIKEYGGKRENAKSNELSAEERRIIGEYFPEFNKSEDVRMRVNSQGKELTEGQEEFFANSKAVDKDGNLLVLYHGTPRAGFTEFKSGWFTTSKEDAISYSGDRKGRLFDPNEKYEPETLTAGDFRLGYMTFDSEEDRAAFLGRFPYADEVMSEREYEDARMGAEDEEYDALTARRKEFAEVWNAYREYERERFVDTTIADLIANPEAYTEEDLMRAMLEYDSNASLDSLDDMDAAERKDALVSALQNANEETEGGILDMVIPTRVPRNGEGVKHNDLGNRTYEVYANVENPYEIDANGRGSEFESGDIYKSVEEALADEQYDGVIIRNWRVGRTQQLGDVVVPKDGSQIKLTSNENPTESEDVRYRITPEVREEMKTIKEQAEKDGTFMNAPNGLRSNLTEEQWLMVRTKGFKEWFGDWINDPENASKVVDPETGEPMVVYHGTNKEFYEFRTRGVWDDGIIGVHFGTKEQAERVKGPQGQNIIMPVFLNIRNPYRVKDQIKREGSGRLDGWDMAVIKAKYGRYDGQNGQPADGLVYINEYEGKGDSYVVWEKNQIKSATDNTGEFSKESSDIRFRTSLELDEEFGDAWRNQQNEDGRHSTQVANTKSTYEKIGHYLEDAGMKGASILDASSGLGLGTQALREMGFNVDDVEPFPSENREAPTFSSYADIDGKYDVVISNAVLNVIPDDWRAEVLHQMADAVKEGGKMIINTRPASNIAQQGVEGKTRITLDSPSEILVKRGDRIAAYQKGFTSEELAEWIKSELGEGWRVEKATKKNSGISGEGTAVVIKEGDNVSFRTTGTPTDEVVANGVDLTPSQTSEVAANIFAALPEESRKKITEGLNGNILGLKDAILQIPASLASKENWNDEDRAMADIVAEEMTKMAGEMTRPFSAPEALWLLYNNLNKSTDLVSLAQRSLVQRNLGFDAQTLATENEAKESLRFRQVGDARINATAGLYNKGAVNVMTRLKESFVDMNASVEELVKAIEERTGKKAEGFENILWALNQQSSRGLAAMEDYERRFLNPMYDAIRNIMDKAYVGYNTVVRHVILKHGLERNKKLAQRDAKAHYQEIYEDMIAKVNSMDDRQKRTHLTNAQLQDADAKAKLATLKAADTSAFTEEEKNAHKRELAKAKEEVKKAKENLERAQKINSMSEQELKDELDRVFEKIENGTDSVYKELRKNDYSGISSMFYDQLGVNRKDYSTEEEYQAALMLAKNDRFSSLEEVEAQAEGEVESFEGRVDTKELWKRINAATKETLRQQYEANMISKDQYESLRDMFEYYVPLRGFKDNTAEDMYTYYRKPNSTGYTKPILGAEGRKTEAESPFGWIASMAGSAIASNVKNEAKLALFYFVSNRQDNGVATISKTWYVHTPGDVDERGKKIFKPVYPPFSEDLSSDAAKAQYEQWQDDMRKLKEQGLAYEAGQRLNLGNAVVNISDANKPEHIVAVKVGGKEYTIVINGNPRAAQAINGELNLEGTADDYSALFGPVLRWMSSVNTSYNPEFWITNMMRDMAFTWMAVNTKEADNKEYRRKFSKNYRKAFKVISLVAKNEKGTLGNSPIEQAYKDFVENGGVTGYTQIKDNETWEKEIDQYLRSNSPESLKSGKMMRGMKTVFHAAHRFGESLEQVSRFAAFLTAQEMGKSINEAINDAKEITVNFNRKGSGKMISLEEAKHLTDKNGRPLSKPKQWMVVGLSSIAPLGRRFIMFFNAAIQGLNATYKLWKANPKRFKGWVMGYFAVGAMNAILHAMMDDDDDYLDMPQYERRNALMIGGNGAYLKWALPQEARAFYALGDIVVESMLGRNPQKFWQKGGEVGQILTTIGEVLPINPTEGWRAFAPSIAIPALELMINEDYKGEAIYNDSKWLSKEEASRTANWNTAKSGTGWVHVKIAQSLNFLTGGDKYDAGLINIRPEAIEHLVQSAFGGTIRTADKFITTISAAIDPEEDVTVSQTPFLNRVLTLNDQRYRNVYVNEVFDYYAAEAEHAKTLEKKYRKDGNSDALLDLTSSDEYKWMMIYENYKKPLENVRERLKVAEGTRERKQIMREQDELKKMMIKQISNL